MPSNKPTGSPPVRSAAPPSSILIPVLFALALVIAQFLIATTARGQQYDFLVRPMLALTNSAEVVKASPGTLLWYSCVNPNAAAVYIQAFNSAGVVVIGTTVPTFSFRVAPTSSTGFAVPQVQGAYFFTAGLQAAATTTAGGSTAPTSPVPCDFAIR